MINVCVAAQLGRLGIKVTEGGDKGRRLNAGQIETTSSLYSDGDEWTRSRARDDWSWDYRNKRNTK